MALNVFLSIGFWEFIWLFGFLGFVFGSCFMNAFLPILDRRQGILICCSSCLNKFFLFFVILFLWFGFDVCAVCMAIQQQ